jgi:hypothetical protein
VNKIGLGSSRWVLPVTFVMSVRLCSGEVVALLCRTSMHLILWSSSFWKSKLKSIHDMTSVSGIVRETFMTQVVRDLRVMTTGDIA